MRVSLYDLNDNVLVLISTYLTLRDIISCRLSSKTLSKQFQNDIIWQQIVLEELGMNELTAPPDDMFPIPSTYESMYRDWMMSFPEYSAVEIKIVTVWWKRMGKWLRQNAPPIYATLNKPPTNQQWKKLVETGFKVPYYMKLLYRFHNGQKLRNGAETRLGLFGCYDFYSEEFNFYFLNLKNISEAELNIFTPHPSSPTAAYYVPSTPFICNQDSQQNISFRTVSSNVLQEKDLSVTTPENETEKSAIRKSDKLLCVFGDRRCMSEHVVPANTSYDLNYPTIFPKVVPNKSALFAWLYEYLYRLESGVYRYRHVHAFDEISTPCKSISLFPSCTSTGANSGDVKFVRTVTDGVEVTASWIYLPIISTLDRLTWTYSITLRLLPDHPSRPSNLIHCRLLSRHWIIRNYEDDSMISEDVVDGEGVIGLFPVLKISDNFDNPFRYQSCMEAKLSQPRTWEHSTARTVLSGYLTFENLSAPVGQREVRAYLDELEFVCPKFIY